MDAKQLPDTAPSTSPADRLDSWKEIAAYLRRDVRTVQRWHDRAGLPVHRHIDAKQRGVFAFRCELDDWANRSRSAVEDESAPPPSSDPRRRGLVPFTWFPAVAVTLLFVAAVWIWQVRV